MTDAWMPGAERLSAAADGGGLKGGAPRAVWLVLHADPMTVSARAAAERLIELGRPRHLVWNPLSGDVAQLIPGGPGRAGARLGRRPAAGGPGQRAWAGVRAPGRDSRAGAPDAAGRRPRIACRDGAERPGLGRGTATGSSRTTGRAATTGRSSRTGPRTRTGRRTPARPMGRTGRRASAGPTAGPPAAWPRAAGRPPEEPIAPSARDGLAGSTTRAGSACRSA